MAETVKVFDECKITDTHVKIYDRKTGELATGQATRLGCVGKLNLSSEYKSIVKNCEGIEEKKVKKLTKLTGTISVHMPLAIARTVFGLSNDGLVEGVYALSDTSQAPNMCLTTKAIDLFTEEEKLICLPNIIFTDGFAKTIDNTSEEIAEIELNFDAYRDANKKFYYDTIVSEVSDTVANQWLTNFESSIVLKTV